MATVNNRTTIGRGAEATRGRLLEAARRRFAMDGYRGTTVRCIAQDANVNVALINRYFGSKERLFEACIGTGTEEFEPAADGAEGPTATDIINRLIEQIVSPADAIGPLQMLVLLRSSGDTEVEAVSRRTLEYFTETLARAAGWVEGDPSTNEILMRAQVVLAAAAGLILFRASTQVNQAASTTAEELATYLREAFATLLG